MYDKSQLMRGTLEGCILKILSQNTSYGYEIVTTLLGCGFKDIKEGTIYPLLVRLEKKELLPLRCSLLHWVQAENIIPLHQME
mgnify:FL=1